MLLLLCKNRQQLVRNAAWLIVVGHFLTILILLSTFGSEFVQPVIIRSRSAAPVRFMQDAISKSFTVIQKEQKIVKKNSKKKSGSKRNYQDIKVPPKKVFKEKSKKKIKEVKPKKPRVEKKEIVEEKKITPQKQELLVQQQEELLTEPIYIGKEDTEMLILHKQIRDALQEQWHVPTGLSPETFCKLVVSLGRDGKVIGVTVEESSDNIIYTTAARSAVIKTVYPKEVWGKKIPLLFSQGI